MDRILRNGRDVEHLLRANFDLSGLGSDPASFYSGRVVVNEILTLEHAGWKALCESRGADFYGQIMTETAVMVLSNGFALDREAVVASLDDAPAWHEYEISNERLIEIDSNSVALVYTGRASRVSSEPVFHALMSSVYTRQEGGWRLALYQQTPVPDRK